MKHRFVRFSVLGLVLFVSLAFLAPQTGFAQTTDVASLQAQIAALLQQIQSLQAQLASTQGGTASCYTFNNNLMIGSTGTDVTELQTMLQKNGESVNVNGTFDDQTAAAVTGFQEKYQSAILAPYGLTNGTGYVGPSTRAQLNAIYGCNAGNEAPGLPTPQPTPPVTVTPTNGASSALSIVTDPNIAMQAQSVAPGGKGYILVAADLTAGAQSSVTITSLSFGCGGYACDAVTNLKIVSGAQSWSGSASNEQMFTPNLVIPAGTTKVVTLVGDISASAPAGLQIAYGLDSKSVVLSDSGAVAGGAFGNTLTISGTSSNPTVDLTVNGSNGPVKVSSGGPLNLVWNSQGASGACTVVFNPAGVGTYNIATGLSGNTNVAAPNVSAASAYLYQVVCPVPSPLGVAQWINDTVQVNVIPAAVTPTGGQPSITVVYPNGGEVLNDSGTGNIATIQWTSSSMGALNVDIALMGTSGDAVKYIANSVPNTGSYAWHVDPTIPNGNYKIDVSSDDKGPSASDESNAFFQLTGSPLGTATNPVITVTTPQAGSGYTVGQPIPTFWNESGFTPKNINVYLNGLSTRATLASIGASTATSLFDLTVPNNTPAGSHYTISVCDEGVPSPASSGKPLCGTSAEFMISPLLNVWENPALIYNNLIGGTAGAKVASYLLSAPSTEALNVKNLSVLVSAHGDALRNLRLLSNGAQFGATQPAGTTGAFNFNDGITIPAGSTATVDVLADIASNVQPGNQITAYLSCYGVGQISNAAYTCGSVAGQTMTLTTLTPPPSASVPAQVQNLQISTYLGNGAKLTWSPVGSNGGAAIGVYNIYRTTGNASISDNPGRDATLLAQINGTSYTDANLPVGTYYYRVAAQDVNGIVGPASNYATIQFAGSAASTPTITGISPDQTSVSGNVAISGANLISGGNPAIEFYSSGGALAGTVYFINMNYLSSQSIVFSPNASSMALTPGTYQVDVLTPNGRSNKVALTVAAASAPAASVPLQVQNLQVAPSGTNGATLTWSAVAVPRGSATIGAYNIYRSTSPTAISDNPGRGSTLLTQGNVLTFTDQNLQSGTTYYYRVRLWDEVGTLVALH